MNFNLDQFVRTLKDIAHKVTDSVQHFFDGEPKKQTAEEIAAQIMYHTQTKKKTQTLLGLTFHDYRLEQDGFLFHLETKGKMEEKIICFSISSSSGFVYTYRSYNENDTLKKKLPFPLNS